MAVVLMGAFAPAWADIGDMVVTVDPGEAGWAPATAFDLSFNFKGEVGTVRATDAAVAPDGSYYVIGLDRDLYHYAADRATLLRTVEGYHTSVDVGYDGKVYCSRDPGNDNAIVYSGDLRDELGFIGPADNRSNDVSVGPDGTVYVIREYDGNPKDNMVFVFPADDWGNEWTGVSRAVDEVATIDVGQDGTVVVASYPYPGGYRPAMTYDAELNELGAIRPADPGTRAHGAAVAPNGLVYYIREEEGSPEDRRIYSCRADGTPGPDSTSYDPDLRFHSVDIGAAGGIVCDPGDADGDGDVDDDDLSLLLANWGSEAATCQQGEFSNAPPVNDDDLSLLLANWTGTPASAAPEPTAMALIALGGLTLIRRKR